MEARHHRGAGDKPDPKETNMQNLFTRLGLVKFARVIGLILVSTGMLLLASSFLVELTIFSDDPGLGLRQIMGIITGSGAAIAGMILILGRQRETILVLRILGIVFLVGGAVVLLGSLLIDFAGIRTSPGFGLRQIAGTITGVFVLVVGGCMLFKLKNFAG